MKKYRRLVHGDKIPYDVEYKWGEHATWQGIRDKVWIDNNPIYRDAHPTFMRAPIKTNKEKIIRAF